MFISILLCGARNHLMDAFKVFIKPFEAPQSVKIENLKWLPTILYSVLPKICHSKTLLTIFPPVYGKVKNTVPKIFSKKKLQQNTPSNFPKNCISSQFTTNYLPRDRLQLVLQTRTDQPISCLWSLSIAKGFSKQFLPPVNGVKKLNN